MKGIASHATSECIKHCFEGTTNGESVAEVFRVSLAEFGESCMHVDLPTTVLSLPQPLAHVIVHNVWKHVLLPTDLIMPTGCDWYAIVKNWKRMAIVSQDNVD